MELPLSLTRPSLSHVKSSTNNSLLPRPPLEYHLPRDGPPPFFGHHGSSFLHGVTPPSLVTARVAREIPEGGLRWHDGGRLEAVHAWTWHAAPDVDLACGGGRESGDGGE
jgi:hypothetical protein